MRKLYPSKNKKYQKYVPSALTCRFKIFDEARRVFEVMTGSRTSEYITGGQFQKLCHFPGMRTGVIMKAHYDIIFKNKARKANGTLMTIEHFFDALEELAERLHEGQPLQSSLGEIITTLATCLTSET